MSEKVKLTRKQARMIENHKDAFEMLMSKHRSKNTPTRIDNLTTQQVVDAYFGDYEVEPEFKMGQYIYDITDKNKTVIEVAYVTDKRVHGFWKTQYSDIDTHVAIENARHFTKEEIDKEKERRWWAKHGREPWELKQGDVLIKLCSSFYFEALEVENVDDEYITLDDYRQINYKTTNMKINYKVVCFAEDRKDVDHE